MLGDQTTDSNQMAKDVDIIREILFGEQMQRLQAQLTALEEAWVCVGGTYAKVAGVETIQVGILGTATCPVSGSPGESPCRPALPRGQHTLPRPWVNQFGNRHRRRLLVVQPRGMVGMLPGCILISQAETCPTPRRLLQGRRPGTTPNTLRSTTRTAGRR